MGRTFMPGLFVAVAYGMGHIVADLRECKNWKGSLYFLVVGAFFPVIVPFIFIYNIGRMM